MSTGQLHQKLPVKMVFVPFPARPCCQLSSVQGTVMLGMKQTWSQKLFLSYQNKIFGCFLMSPDVLGVVGELGMKEEIWVPLPVPCSWVTWRRTQTCDMCHPWARDRSLSKTGDTDYPPLCDACGRKGLSRSSELMGTADWGVPTKEPLRTCSF